MSDHAAIQNEIEQARAEVSATVHELALRLDVPKRVKRKADDVRSSLKARPALILGAAAGLGVVVIVLIRGRRG